MKTFKPTSAGRPSWRRAPLLFGVILLLLFCKSFLPDYVHFSNDGPLGALIAEWSHMPRGFAGYWNDLNAIGGSGGSFTPNFTMLYFGVVGPVFFAKFSAPIALFLLGLGAWTFFRQLKFSPLAAILGGLAAMLNSAYFSAACWGIASQQVGIAMDFFALALIVSNNAGTPVLVRWARLALAGLCVGLNVMEAVDVGAIFSMLVALFVFFKSLADDTGSTAAKCVRGVGRVAVVTIFAAFIAMQTVISLVGLEIQGIAGAGQNTETSAQHWDWATQWSLPKTETLGLFVPGVFGFKMDTPSNMPDYLRSFYQDGLYWGGMGRDPVLDRYFDSGSQGPMPAYNYMRQTGGQNYGGITVALIALWAMAQSFRRKDSVFTEVQRRHILFWTVILLGSIFLAWGRFAPFDLYQHTIYRLPYFSNVRSPAKFVLIFSIAVVTLFAYGVNGLSQRYLLAATAAASSFSAQFKNWWARASGFDRKWTWTCVGLVGASLAGALVYASEKPDLVRYLQKVGFNSPEWAGQVADFSIRQAGWFVVLIAAVAGLSLLIIAGCFTGKRAKLGGILLGLLLVLDLVRADLPFVIHWNYKVKYASNAIIDFLRNKPYENRVMKLPQPGGLELPGYDRYFGDLYDIEWIQQLFQYYDIQSLNVIQRSRMPADELAYEMAFVPSSPETSYLVARHWQLANVRYFLGAAGLLDSLNDQLDPVQHRFRIIQRFDVVPKPGVLQPSQPADLTAVPSDNGACALFEFTGALPRAKLYAHWQVSTNDEATLQTLASTNFDPAQTVLVSTPLPVPPPAGPAGTNSGTVDFKSYTPEDIAFNVNADAASVLLFNSKYDPTWRVSVDGRPAELLRCNYIMRGVMVPAGKHTVEFSFNVPNKPLYVTIAALVTAVLLSGFLIYSGRRKATVPGP